MIILIIEDKEGKFALHSSNATHRVFLISSKRKTNSRFRRNFQFIFDFDILGLDCNKRDVLSFTFDIFVDGGSRTKRLR